jgi:hypothetical protein
MLFGDKEAFAIEAMVESGLTPPSTVWGRMRIWCNNLPLGDYSNANCGLPAAHLQELCAEVQHLWHPSFDGLEDSDLFHHLDVLLFGCPTESPSVETHSPEECTTGAETLARFSFLTNWGEMFDTTGKCFVVCQDGKTVKIIHQPASAADCITFQFSTEAIQTACTQFGLWYSEQSTALS